MIIWAGLLGAISGWLAGDFSGFGFVLGGLIGVVGGLGLQRAVRAEISRETQALHARIEGLLKSGPDVPYSPPERRERPAAAQRSEQAPERRNAPRPITENPGEFTILATTVIDKAKAWMLGGNLIVRAGLVILFVGLSFLASYAAAAGLFPIELRLALVAAFGIALLAVGFRTRNSRPAFGLTLQGGGVAIVYLTLFAAAKLYEIFPITATFVLMILVCALGCALALVQRSQALAATAFAGGFAVPLLLSDGSGEIGTVFTYYTILNLAVFFIAQRQPWRVLNLIGFLATFGVAAIWQAAGYQQTDFVVTQAFLAASMAIYVGISIFHARAAPGTLGNVVDTTLLFGPAIVGFGVQVGLLEDQRFGSASAALGFAALYLAAAGWSMRYRPQHLRITSEAMLAIAIGFVTLAVPLAFDARWTSAAWALQGAGAFWVGMRQARWMPRLFGIFLQIVAALIYVGGLQGVASPIPFGNGEFLGAMLISVAALSTAWWLRAPIAHSGSPLAHGYARFEGQIEKPAFLFGFGFWCLAWMLETTRVMPPGPAGQPPVPIFAFDTRVVLIALIYVMSAWVAQSIARRYDWAVARWPGHMTLAALVLAFIGVIASGRHILQMPGWIIWIAMIVLHLRILYLDDLDRAPTVPHRLTSAAHTGGVWLATAIVADCLWLGIDRARLWDTAWPEVIFLVAATAILAALTYWAGQATRGQAVSQRWPVDRHAAAYGWFAAVPIALLVFVGALLTACLSSGAAPPLPYLPLLNPVELSLCLSLVVLERWRRVVLASDAAEPGADWPTSRSALAALAGLAFVVINTVWLRVAHHLLGVAWDADALLSDVVVQTGLAILWTVIALTLMIFAHRGARRTLWLVGAGLLGLTVAKLVLVDLGAASSAARIVAFIVVGVLMLVVGYFAPLPPRAELEPDTPQPGDIKHFTA